MSLVLRIALIVVSSLVVVFVLKKIRKTQLHISDALYWIFAAILLLCISIFPQIAILASDALGIMSAANFVFLVMIFLILVKLFNVAIELSIQKERLNRLAQKLALLHERNGLDLGADEKNASEKADEAQK